MSSCHSKIKFVKLANSILDSKTLCLYKKTYANEKRFRKSKESSKEN